MKAPQYGKYHKGNKRSNNAALPLPELVRGKHGKLVRLDLSARRPAIGRADPPRDKRISRNDNRHYQGSRTPDRRWQQLASGVFTLRAGKQQ